MKTHVLKMLSAAGATGALILGLVGLVTGNPGSGSHGQLLWTRDAGRTWYTVRF